MHYLLMKMFVVITFSTSFLLANSEKDNKALLLELKDCCSIIMEQNLERIELNRDGTRTSKNITPSNFSTQSLKIYKRLQTNKTSLNSLANNHDKEQLGQALATFLSAARIAIANIQSKINTDGDGTINPKNFYPAVFGRLVANEYKKRTGISIKQTTTGRGMGARNSQYNSPDSWETQALAKIESKGWDVNTGLSETTAEGFRYIHPLEIKKSCLSCHGDPKGEKDISGYIKEGYKLNDIRGGISVLIPTATH